MIFFVLFTAAFGLTAAGVGRFRNWSLKKNILDLPNERSSHTTPTPRGGGIVVVIVALSLYTIAANLITGDFSTAYVVGAILIAAVSWLDDLFSISIVWRFAVHACCAILAVWQIGVLMEIPFSGRENEYLKFAEVLMTVGWIVWLTNAYNFMDGIDGIAGTQAVTAGFGWCLVGILFGAPATAAFGGILSFSALGFLVYNWQPARVFLGDVGSAFFGYTFAVLPLTIKKTDDTQILVPVIAVLLVWFFIFDAVYTFAKRLLRRAKVWQPHREHLYQRLVIGGCSHRLVTVFYGVNSLTILAAMILGLNLRDYFLWIVIMPLIAQTAGLLVFVRLRTGKLNS